MSSAEAIPTVAMGVAEEFSFQEQGTFEVFEQIGYGPFVVQRSALLQEVLKTANPMCSVHISGCKGAGKTTVLNLLGRQLSQQNQEIYFFDNASELSREPVIQFVKTLVKSKRVAYLLVDETQENTSAPLFTTLLKNTRKHNITVIGAGVRSSFARNGRHSASTLRVFSPSFSLILRVLIKVPKFDSMSAAFQINITTPNMLDTGNLQPSWMKLTKVAMRK